MAGLRRIYGTKWYHKIEKTFTMALEVRYDLIVSGLPVPTAEEFVRAIYPRGLGHILSLTRVVRVIDKRAHESANASDPGRAAQELPG